MARFYWQRKSISFNLQRFIFINDVPKEELNFYITKTNQLKSIPIKHKNLCKYFKNECTACSVNKMSLEIHANQIVLLNQNVLLFLHADFLPFDFKYALKMCSFLKNYFLLSKLKTFTTNLSLPLQLSSK